MGNNNLIAVIDPGTSNIKVFVGQKGDHGTRLSAGAIEKSSGIRRGEIINTLHTSDCLARTLKKIKDEQGVEINQAYIVCATEDMACLSKNGDMDRSANLRETVISRSELDSMKKDIAEACKSQGRMVYSTIPQVYSVDDWMGLPESEVEGTMGRHISASYKVITGKSSFALACGKVLENVGIEVKGYIVSPIASAYSTLSEDERELGVALVDIGSSKTSIVVIKENIVRYVAVISFGGNNITEDIMKECNVVREVAEEIKRHHSSCIPALAEHDRMFVIPSPAGKEKRKYSFDFISEIIGARVSEILEAVLWHIEQSGYMEELGMGLVLTGGSSNILHIDKLAEQITRLGTRIGEPSGNISNDTEINISDPSYSAAIGAIQYCLNEYAQPEYITDFSKNRFTSVNHKDENLFTDVEKDKGGNKKVERTDADREGMEKELERQKEKERRKKEKEDERARKEEEKARKEEEKRKQREEKERLKEERRKERASRPGLLDKLKKSLMDSDMFTDDNEA